MKYQIVGLTDDGKRATICYTRSAWEARSIQAAGSPRFSRIVVLDKDGEVSQSDLDERAKAGTASDA